MKAHPTFFKDICEKDLVTRSGRLGSCRYNRFSLQVESVYSDYHRVAILGNDNTYTHQHKELGWVRQDKTRPPPPGRPELKRTKMLKQPGSGFVRPRGDKIRLFPHSRVVKFQLVRTAVQYAVRAPSIGVQYITSTYLPTYYKYRVSTEPKTEPRP
jgi:hypothetical protein